MVWHREGLHLATNEMLDLNHRHYGNFFYSSALAALGVYLCLSLSSLLQRVSFLRRGLGYVGHGSLFILIFHSYIEGKCFEVLKPFVASPYLNGLLGMAVALVVPLILWEITKRSRFLSGLLLPAKVQTKSSQSLPRPSAETGLASDDKAVGAVLTA